MQPVRVRVFVGGGTTWATSGALADEGHIRVGARLSELQTRTETTLARALRRAGRAVRHLW